MGEAGAAAMAAAAAAELASVALVPTDRFLPPQPQQAGEAGI